jgi:hypothetical protein
MGSRRWQGRCPCQNGWNLSRRHRHQRPDDDGRSQVDHRSDSTISDTCTDGRANSSPGDAAPAADKRFTGNAAYGRGLSSRPHSNRQMPWRIISSRLVRRCRRAACWLPLLPQSLGRDGTARQIAGVGSGNAPTPARQHDRLAPPPPSRQTDARHPAHRHALLQRAHSVQVPSPGHRLVPVSMCTRHVIGRRGVQVPSPALLDVHPIGGMIVSAP